MLFQICIALIPALLISTNLIANTQNLQNTTDALTERPANGNYKFNPAPACSNSYIFNEYMADGCEKCADSCEKCADSCEKCVEPEPVVYYCCPQYELKFRMARFFFANRSIRENFGKTATSYELEGLKILNSNTLAWINLNWLSKGSKKDSSHHHVKLNVANLSFGINLQYCVDQYLSVYLGVGPNFSSLNISRHSNNNYRKGTKFGVGAVFKSGVNFTINPGFFLELFADYLYQPVKFKKRQSVSGAKVGASIGVIF